MGVWWHALAFVTHERAKMSHKPGRNVTQAGPKCHTRAKMSHSHVIIMINAWLRMLPFKQCVDLSNAKPMLQMHIHHFIFNYIEGKLTTKAPLDHHNCCILLLLNTISVINSRFDYSRAEQMPAAALGGQWVSAWPTDLANVKAEIWRSTFVTLLKISANKCIP